mmetsp:Transcript_8742/g.22609  ORF Transcript_8742/g.22609 Transcript_8742/m.22609 type:complete len:250 (+) Transcript_8742:164-913(+)
MSKDLTRSRTLMITLSVYCRSRSLRSCSSSASWACLGNLRLRRWSPSPCSTELSSSSFALSLAFSGDRHKHSSWGKCSPPSLSYASKPPAARLSSKFWPGAAEAACRKTRQPGVVGNRKAQPISGRPTPLGRISAARSCTPSRRGPTETCEAPPSASSSGDTSTHCHCEQSGKTWTSKLNATTAQASPTSKPRGQSGWCSASAESRRWAASNANTSLGLAKWSGWRGANRRAAAQYSLHSRIGSPKLWT